MMLHFHKLSKEKFLERCVHWSSMDFVHAGPAKVQKASF